MAQNSDLIPLALPRWFLTLEGVRTEIGIACPFVSIVQAFPLYIVTRDAPAGGPYGDWHYWDAPFDGLNVTALGLDKMTLDEFSDWFAGLANKVNKSLRDLFKLASPAAQPGTADFDNMMVNTRLEFMLGRYQGSYDSDGAPKLILKPN